MTVGRTELPASSGWWTCRRAFAAYGVAVGCVVVGIGVFLALGGGWDGASLALAAATLAGMAGGGVGLLRSRQQKRETATLAARERAMSQSPNGIMITDPNQPDNPIIYVNPAFTRITGYAPEEALGRNARFLSRDDRDQTGIAAVRAALRDERPVTAELRNFRKDGTTFWNRLSISPVHDERGRLTLFVGIQTDVTVARDAEAALREARDKLDAVFDNVGVGIGLTDAEGNLSAVNAAFRRILGADRKELMGRNVAALFVGEAEGGGSGEPDGGRPSTRECTAETGDGRRVHLLRTQRRMTLGEDQRMLVVTIEDITAIKEAEKDMAKLAQIMEGLLELPVVFFRTDAEGIFTEVLGAGLPELGFRSKELVGLPLVDVFPQVAAPARRALSGGRERCGASGTFMGRSWAYDMFLTFDAMSGTGVVGFCMDVSERQRAEERLQGAIADYSRSNEELERFAYIASHDLREPLRMINSYLQLVERRYGERMDDAGREFIRFAVDGGQRMDRLILDLLEYSRIGRKAKPLEPHAMGLIVEAALRNLQVAIGEAGATVEVAPDLPTVKVDDNEVARLVQNLIGNAIKYRAPDVAPVIRLGVVRRDAMWEFAVADNGIGIEPEHFERIFMIFQRLHTRQEYEGTGIGLALCRKIVERHGGRIWLTSKPGQGSTFFFTLPVMAANA